MRTPPLRHALAALLILSGPALARPAGVARFDGTWSVEILTESGTCDRAYRYPVRIQDGQARFVGTAFTVDGRVTAAGTLRGSVSNGLATALIAGRLGADGLGAGTWTASGSVACRGRWNAERRG